MSRRVELDQIWRNSKKPLPSPALPSGGSESGGRPEGVVSDCQWRGTVGVRSWDITYLEITVGFYGKDVQRNIVTLGNIVRAITKHCEISVSSDYMPHKT